MTRLAFVATAALAPMLATGPMFAAVRIQIETTNLATKKVTTDQILLDSNRLRFESDDGKTMMFLTDGGRNRMVMLDKARNTYQEIDEQTMNQMGQQMSAAMAQMQAQMKNMTPEQRAMMEKMMKGKMPQAAAAPKTVYTPKGSGSVNGFSCTKYEGDRSGEKLSELCAALPAQLKLTADDLQIYEKMRQFSTSLLGALANSPVRINVPAASSAFEAGYDGFPIQRVNFDNGQAVDRSELKSITRTSFTDADFSLGNAKKVELPIPGGPQGKQR
jgi:hypothetical protein